MDEARGYKILIVDDEKPNRLILRTLLKQLGHTGIPVESADEALEMLDPSFDLVMSDVMMPVMDGLEMVRLIRKNPETVDIPVIMVTALSDEEDRIKAIEAGATDFIIKPVNIENIKNRIQIILEQKNR